MGSGFHSIVEHSEVDDGKTRTASLVFILVLTVLLISVLTIFAWQLDIVIIRNPFYIFSTMNPLTAVCFFLTSGSYLIHLTRRKAKVWNFLLKLVASILMLTGLLRLSSAVGILSFNIDEILFSAKFSGFDNYNLSYRMSPGTGLCILLLGASTMAVYHTKRWHKVAANYGALLIGWIALFYLAGFLYEVGEFRELLSYNVMSVQSSICFLWLTVAILCSPPYVGFIKPVSSGLTGGLLSRVLLPMTALLAFLLGFFVLRTTVANQLSHAFSVALLVFSMVSLLFLLIWLIAHLMFKKEAQVLAAQQEIIRLNRTLESEVKDRTRELRQYKDALDMTALVAITDRQGIITHVNDIFCGISKYNREALLGKRFQPLLIPQFSEAQQQDAEQVLVSGKIWTGELKSRAADGSIYWMETTAVPFFNENGDVYQFMVIGKEITQRKELETTLIRRENYLNSILSTEPECVKLLDAAGHMQYVNKAGLIMVEADNLEAVLGKSFIDLINTEYRGAFEQLIADVFKGRAGTLQFEVQSLKGNSRWVESHAVPLKDESDEIVSLLAITRDISSQRRYEQQLKVEKDLSESLFNSLPGIVILANQKGTFLRWNDDLESVSGYTGKEISEMHPVDFIAPEDKALVTGALKKVMQHGSYAAQVFLLTKANEKIPYYLQGRKIEYGGELCILGTGLDYSERAKFQQELKEQAQTLRDLAQHLQTIREEERAFLAKEIHDELGQLLTAIKLDVQGALLSDGAHSLSGKVVKRLDDAVDLLNVSIQAVRRLSSELHPRLVEDLGLPDALRWQSQEFEKKSSIPCRFICTQPEITLPKEKALALYRVCQESLTNIMRHAQATEARVTLQPTADKIMLTVKDNGKGFDTQQMSKEKRFGLAGMRERIENLGGELFIHSSAQRGTVVGASLSIDQP